MLLKLYFKRMLLLIFGVAIIFHSKAAVAESGWVSGEVFQNRVYQLRLFRLSPVDLQSLKIRVVNKPFISQDEATEALTLIAAQLRQSILASPALKANYRNGPTKQNLLEVFRNDYDSIKPFARTATLDSLSVLLRLRERATLNRSASDAKWKKAFVGAALVWSGIAYYLDSRFRLQDPQLVRVWLAQFPVYICGLFGVCYAINLIATHQPAFDTDADALASNMMQAAFPEHTLTSKEARELCEINLKGLTANTVLGPRIYDEAQEVQDAPDENLELSESDGTQRSRSGGR